MAVVGWFLEAGLASQLGQSARNQALGYVLRLSSPAHTSRKGMARIDRDPARTRDHIRELLDAGADPNSANLVSVSAHYNEFGNRLSRSTSPLSSAIQADRPDLVRILIDRGANVNGRLTALVKKSPALPHHVPVCAAAFTMAHEGQDSSSMQQLLACGAVLNICVPFCDTKGASKQTTPLAIFLTQVSRWPPKKPNQRNPGKKEICIRTAVENLQLLLDNGASEAPHRDQSDGPVLKLIMNMNGPPTNASESQIHAFFLMGSILKVLIRNAILEDDMIWPSVESCSIRCQLQDLTAGKETLFRETITRFLQAGADINFRLGVTKHWILGNDFMGGSTVLQALCYKYRYYKFGRYSVNLVCMLVKDFKADPYSHWARNSEQPNKASIDMLHDVFDRLGANIYEVVKIKWYVATALAEMELELVEKWMCEEELLAKRVEHWPIYEDKLG
ncbi:hypothetical protein V8F06_006631 [Rhypophila decipiens]